MLASDTLEKFNNCVRANTVSTKGPIRFVLMCLRDVLMCLRGGEMPGNFIKLIIFLFALPIIFWASTKCQPYTTKYSAAGIKKLGPKSKIKTNTKNQCQNLSQAAHYGGLKKEKLYFFDCGGGGESPAKGGWNEGEKCVRQSTWGPLLPGTGIWHRGFAWQPGQVIC